MPIKPKGAAATPAPAPTPAPAATPAGRVRSKIKAVAPTTPAPTPAEEAAPAATATPAPAPAAPTRIMTAAARAAAAKAAPKIAATPKAEGEAAAADDDDDLSWAASGEEARAKAEALAAQKEAAKEERRARGYWPIRFGLIPPSQQYPDRYMADVILLDAKPGPAYYEHVLKNPKTNRWDVIEPCPKEFDNCCLCPPASDRDSQFVMLLSFLNINGYTYRSGERAGQHVPITKELAAVMVGDQPFYHDLMAEHGTLRGIQLTMTRKDRFDPQMGKPSFVGKFTDEQIEQHIRDNGLWAPKVTREGETIAAEDHLMHPFKYAEFLHKPSGADLRARYANGAGLASGQGGADSGQWGGSRYQPGVAGGPGAGGGAGPNLDDLADDIPF